MAAVRYALQKGIAVLRIDGNFYESYQDALYYLWELVPVGGFVIFDDYVEGKNAPWLGHFWAELKRAHGLRLCQRRGLGGWMRCSTGAVWYVENI